MSGVADVVIAVGLRDELVSRVGSVLGPVLRASGQALSDAQLGRQAELLVDAGLVLGAIFAVGVVALAVATLRGPRQWLGWIDLGLLAAGALAPFALIAGGPFEAPRPQPPLALGTGIVVSVVDAGVLLVAVPALAGRPRRSSEEDAPAR